MFRKMRRNDRALNREEAFKILEVVQYGVLSTIGGDGYPYGIPISYAVTDGAIYFHCALEGQKLDNIRHDSRVSFCAVGNTTPLPGDFAVNYESVVVFGKAEEVTGAEKQKALEAILVKYSRDFFDKGLEYISKAGAAARVVKINIEHITGKARK